MSFLKEQLKYDSMMPEEKDPVAHSYTGYAGTGSACFEFVDGEVVSVEEGGIITQFYEWNGEQCQLDAADKHAEELWRTGERL